MASPPASRSTMHMQCEHTQPRETQHWSTSLGRFISSECAGALGGFEVCGRRAKCRPRHMSLMTSRRRCMRACPCGGERAMCAVYAPHRCFLLRSWSCFLLDQHKKEASTQTKSAMRHAIDTICARAMSPGQKRVGAQQQMLSRKSVDIEKVCTDINSSYSHYDL